MTAESFPSAIQQLSDNSQKPRNHYGYFPEHHKRTWSLHPWTWDWDRVTGLQNTFFFPYFLDIKQIHAGISLQKIKNQKLLLLLPDFGYSLLLLIRYFDSTTIISEGTPAFKTFSSIFSFVLSLWVRTVTPVTKERWKTSAEKNK